MDLDKLWIKSAVAGTAATLKRFTPKARGSAGPILKRTCHIKIVLSGLILWAKKPIPSDFASPSTSD